MNLDNYSNDLWHLIYDEYNQGRHELERAFYSKELATTTGPVLEVACGTGMILLPMLKQGIDMYGFDLSEQMLGALYAKVDPADLPDIKRRVSRQNMTDFDLGMQFEAIIIPARSFLHLITQQDQIACLRAIRRHLCDDGRFYLNFFTPSLPHLLQHLESDPDFVREEEYPHPSGKDSVRLSWRQINDLTEQIQRITCRFEWNGQIQETPMFLRWIYKNEFELLANLAGLKVANLYSGFDKAPYDGTGDMTWVLEKAPDIPAS